MTVTTRSITGFGPTASVSGTGFVVQATSGNFEYDVELSPDDSVWSVEKSGRNVGGDGTQIDSLPATMYCRANVRKFTSAGSIKFVTA